MEVEREEVVDYNDYQVPNRLHERPSKAKQTEEKTQALKNKKLKIKNLVCFLRELSKGNLICWLLYGSSSTLNHWSNT